MMVSDWSTTEITADIMQTDGDNHSDLFGGDLFSDELLDIYNSSTGADASGTLGNVDIPNLMGQNGDAPQNTKDININTSSMGYTLGELKSTASMNDFTSILESPQQVTSSSTLTSTSVSAVTSAVTSMSTKTMDGTMLLAKNAAPSVGVSVPVAPPQQQQQQQIPQQQVQQVQQQQQVQPQQQQVQQQLAPQQLTIPPPQQVQQQVQVQTQVQVQPQQPQTTTVGKKRAADAPMSSPCMKKKATGKASSKVGNRGSTTNATGRRPSTKHDSKKNTHSVNGKTNSNTSNEKATAATSSVVDVKGDKHNMNNTANKAVVTDPLTLQAQAQKAMAQKVTVNNIKVQSALPVPVAQQPVQNVPPTYQPKAQPIATTTAARASTKTCNVSSAASTTSTVKTEESFKGVAQAAVNNLILSAGQNAARYEAGKNDSNPFSKPVDTSTSHVAALTSNNWVAACAASISDAPPGTAEAAQAAALAAASDPAAAKAARARRATLTADERARQNRDRNREHARNTRLRKKAYVEELKRTLTELVTTRDAAELERRHEKQRELEVREVRYRVMEEFLKLRSKGSEANLLARWVAILEDGFTLTLPRTDYRDMVQNQIGGTRQRNGDGITDPTVQVLRGATECFDDAAKVAIFLQSISNSNIGQAYNCDRKKFMMDGINAMLEWTFTSTNMDNSANIILKGCMRATFSPASNKLVCAEVLFDSGSIVAQVKSLMSFQDAHSPTSGFPGIAETDALLDSVLPQAPPVQSLKQEGGSLPCSVSVSSADKGGDTSSDEECLMQLQCKQEPSD